MKKILWGMILTAICSSLVLLVGFNLSQGADDKTEIINGIAERIGVSPSELHLLNNPVGLKTAYSSGPSYDSGWVPLSQDESKTLTHNLGGNSDYYVVDMQFKSDDVNGINVRYYGGADFGSKTTLGAPNDRVGAYWRSLTLSTITVYRRPEDTYAEKVRIRIWSDNAPDYDSGWLALSPGAAATTLTHNLGGDTDNYVLDMQYKSAGSGVNQRYYGGADFKANTTVGNPDDQVGAYWRSLTSTSVAVYRRPQDTFAEEVRLRIWLRPTATYDSGWVSVNLDQSIIGNHGIGGNVDDYLVDMQFKDAGGFGVNQVFYGGADLRTTDNRVGVYWRSLNASSITFYRRPEDTFAEQVRIRIFRAWKPCPPNYDSGWTTLSPDQSRTLSHTLGGSADNYLVDMQFKSNDANDINLRYYGGADFGTAPAPGHAADDRVGAYWRSLTNAAITVYRRPEDTYVNQARLRIWSMPRPDFDSGWVTLAQNASQILTHDLGGNILDYFVYMEQKAPDINGTNQRYYGGNDFGTRTTSGNANDRVGSYWRSLTSSAITVYRRPEDTFANQVRVRIWRVASPDYSGFPALVPDNAIALAHNLGLPPEHYLVSMMYADNDAANGVNHRYFGGKDFGIQPPAGYNADDRVGAYWRSLTSNEITVYRRPEDGFADWILIRIWGVPPRIYLPLIFRN